MKTLVLLSLLGYVTLALADCDALARLKVKQQWSEAYGSGFHRTEFGEEIWNTLFEIEPKARDLFGRVRGDNVHSPDFRAHSARVLGGLDMSISVLDDAAVLTAQLAHLSAQHNARSIPKEYFDLFKRALLEVVPHMIGEQDFDQDAWSHCYDVIKEGIQKGMA